MPGRTKAGKDAAPEQVIQRQFWRLGAGAHGSPNASAPRLYIETLNEMIDAQTVRISALNNRVPNAVLAVEVVGAAIALALLGSSSRCSTAARLPSCSPRCWSRCCCW